MKICFICRTPGHIVDDEGIKGEPICEECHNDSN